MSSIEIRLWNAERSWDPEINLEVCVAVGTVALFRFFHVLILISRPNLTRKYDLVSAAFFVHLIISLFFDGGRKISGLLLSFVEKDSNMKVVQEAASWDLRPKLITTSTHFRIPTTKSIEPKSPYGAEESQCNCNFTCLCPGVRRVCFLQYRPLWPSLLLMRFANFAQEWLLSEILWTNKTHQDMLL